jgi:hypothetical protein
MACSATNRSLTRVGAARWTPLPHCSMDFPTWGRNLTVRSRGRATQKQNRNTRIGFLGFLTSFHRQTYKRAPNPLMACSARLPTAKRNIGRAGARLPILLLLLGSLVSCAKRRSGQQSTATNASIGVTLRGCLERSKGHVVVVHERNGTRVALIGVGNKVDKLLGHKVEVTGTLMLTPRTTGVDSPRQGMDSTLATPAIDGYPLKIENVRTDVVSVSNHCEDPE